MMRHSLVLLPNDPETHPSPATNPFLARSRSTSPQDGLLRELVRMESQQGFSSANDKHMCWIGDLPGTDLCRSCETCEWERFTAPASTKPDVNCKHHLTINLRVNYSICGWHSWVKPRRLKKWLYFGEMKLLSKFHLNVHKFAYCFCFSFFPPPPKKNLRETGSSLIPGFLENKHTHTQKKNHWTNYHLYDLKKWFGSLPLPKATNKKTPQKTRPLGFGGTEKAQKTLNSRRTPGSSCFCFYMSSLDFKPTQSTFWGVLYEKLN